MADRGITGDLAPTPPPHVFNSIKGGPGLSMEDKSTSLASNHHSSHNDVLNVNNNWLDVKDALARNRLIEEQIMKDHRKLEKVIKLLLLGRFFCGPHL